MCARRDSLDVLRRQIDGLAASLIAVMAEPYTPPQITPQTTRPALRQSPAARRPRTPLPVEKQALRGEGQAAGRSDAD